MKSPAGYKPGIKAGWHDAMIDETSIRLKKDNKDLKQRLSILEDLVNNLTKVSTEKLPIEGIVK